MWQPDKPTVPGDNWGVLGPTTCPYCQMLRKDPVFGAMLAFLIFMAIWAMAGAGRE